MKLIQTSAGKIHKNQTDLGFDLTKEFYENNLLMFN